VTAPSGATRHPPPSAPAWRADIDRLRVIGMAAVFAIHVSFVFVPWAPWHVQSRDRSAALGQVVLALAPWVMPLFMLLAGESAYYSLRKRGRRSFVAERVRHLLVPLLIGILVLVPPQVYVERRLSGAFDGSFVAFYPHFFEGIYPRGNFAWHHLWFLGYLLVFGVAGLPLFHWLDGARGRAWVTSAGARAARWGGLLVVALPVVASRVVLSETIALLGGTPADWHNRTLLPGAFVAGYLFATDGRLLRAATGRWREQLAIALLLTVGFFAYAATGDPVARVPPAGTPASFLFWGAYAATGWCWVMALIGAVRRLGGGGALLRRASDSVLPFYLVHQPVIVLVAFVVVQRPWGIAASAATLAAVALLLSLVCTLLLELLTGRWRGGLVLGGDGHGAHPAAPT
jgi:surface polysaccharide O-acyltransferase-like enzyme